MADGPSVCLMCGCKIPRNVDTKYRMVDPQGLPPERCYCCDGGDDRPGADTFERATDGNWDKSGVHTAPTWRCVRCGQLLYGRAKREVESRVVHGPGGVQGRGFFHSLGCAAAFANRMAELGYRLVPKGSE